MTQEAPPYRNPDLPVDDRVADLLGRMTLEEKFWQLFMVPGSRDDPGHDWSAGSFGMQVSDEPSLASPDPEGEARRNSMALCRSATVGALRRTRW